MAELKDLFTIYLGLDIPKKEIPQLINTPFDRFSFVNSYINTKLEEKKSEEVNDVINEKPKTQSKLSNNDSKYSRMEKYVANKNPLNTVMNFFIDKGLTPTLASGFAGNFLAESELNPKAFNLDEKKKGYKGYGRGIAQWSNERVLLFKEFIGKDIEDASLEELLEFVWYEVQQRPKLLSLLSKAITSEEAADLVYRGYENGNTTELATPLQLSKIYGDAWKKLNYRAYNFNDELVYRQNKANLALINYLS